MNDMGSRGAPSGYSSTTAPTGPPASSGYGGRGGMPDGRGGMPDGRGGMPDMHGGMPDGRGGMSDSPQMSSARPFDTIIIRNLPLDCNWQVLREGKFLFDLIFFRFNNSVTGKSVSEALILKSVNPQYDERLFIESPEKYKFRTCYVQIKYCFECQNKSNKQFLYTTCSELVFFREFNEQSLAYCGLTNARMRASEKDLPVFFFILYH
jgi:hypothetical protein